LLIEKIAVEERKSGIILMRGISGFYLAIYIKMLEI
jgi:hypothetical protein